MINKDVSFWRKVDFSLLAERPQHCRGLRPEWTVSFFFSFAKESHLKRPAQLKVPNPQIDDFLDTPAGVEHRRQESIVPNALRCCSVDGFQNRIDLFVFQVVDSSVRRAFEWNRDRPLRKIKLLGVPRRHETEERMNGCESRVACRNTVIPLIFQMREKREDSRRIEIVEIECRNRDLALLGDEEQQ